MHAMEVASLSSPSPIHRLYLCPEEESFLGGSSFTLLCSHRGTPHKHPVLSTSLVSSQSSLFGIPKKQRNVLRVSFCPKVEFCGPHFSHKLNVQNKFPRDVTVRSEITAAGSAGDGCSIPELKMESKVRGACFHAVAAFAAIFLFVLMLVGHPFVLLLNPDRRKFQHFIAKV